MPGGHGSRGHGQGRRDVMPEGCPVEMSRTGAAAIENETLYIHVCIQCSTAQFSRLGNFRCPALIYIHYIVHVPYQPPPP